MNFFWAISSASLGQIVMAPRRMLRHSAALRRCRARCFPALVSSTQRSRSCSCSGIAKGDYHALPANAIPLRAAPGLDQPNP